MKYNIKVVKATQSKLSSVDFNNIPFGQVFSDHMFTADYQNGEWQNLEIVPYADISFKPSMLALHYGQSVFEGMKAFRSDAGESFLFRPEMHAQRLNKSCARLCIPDIPEDLFLEACHKLVDLDKAWIPPAQGSALYLRPFVFATDEMLGVKVSKTYKFIIFTGPVGPYYPKPVRLLAETEYVRAVKGGVGEAKAAGNYAASLLPAKLAADKGYNQIMWMDGHEFKYVQEVGTMNLFFVFGDTVVTPATDGAILKGITRDSILQVLKAKGVKVEVRPISIDEVIQNYEEGNLKEIFGCGTAAVVAFITDVTYNNKEMTLPALTDASIAKQMKKHLDELRSGKLEDEFGWLVPVQKSAVTV